ncbi:LuxR family transcriptional regulator [Nocardia harenae]|uniref:LuxR family transcriptional regulator n=1 Tax=Nocardia harenae TaxID=358707 RepID=UPI000833FFFA|nr:response regulator transcription factor [Nocardia harenae]
MIGLDTGQATRTLLVASDSPFARGDFENTVAVHDRFVLAGTCAWRDVVDRSACRRPDAVVLDTPVARAAELPDVIDRLRGGRHVPMIMLFATSDTGTAAMPVDAVLAVGHGAATALEVLDLLMSGAVLAVAPQRRRTGRGRRADSAAQHRLSNLTERERDVLRLIVDGLSNREVGSRLFLSPDTVKEYVSRILAKLEVTSRIEAAVAAVRAEFGSGDC